MKVSNEDYAVLVAYMREAITRKDGALGEPSEQAYLDMGMPSKLWRWDLLWVLAEGVPISGQAWLKGQYNKGLNDFHIDTALRRAVKELA